MPSLSIDPNADRDLWSIRVTQHADRDLPEKGTTTSQERVSVENRGMTILVIDDDHSVLEVRQLLLEALGHRVLIADSGEKAIDLLFTKAVDVVILDYLMPGMGGEETARAIRKHHVSVPILLSTGCLEVPDRVQTLVTALVPKGAGPSVLIAALDQHLKRPPLSAEPQRVQSGQQAS
jgi:CheY-like chemotaxis protein